MSGSIFKSAVPSAAVVARAGVSAIAYAVLAAGAVVTVDGLNHVKDNSVTLEKSTFKDEGIAGFKPYGVSYPEHYGYSGEGNAAPYINRAVKYHGDVRLRDHNYQCDEGIILENAGAKLIGVGSHAGEFTSRLTFSHMDSPGVRLQHRNQIFEACDVFSDDTRRGSANVDCCDILIAPIDAPFTFLSRPRIRNVQTYGGPMDGVVLGGGAGELGELFLITVSECRRHPFVMGDGTGSSRQNIDLNAFYIIMRACRAIRCGGNWLIGQENDSGVPCAVIVEYCEILSCAHDPNMRVSEHQFVDRGRLTVIKKLDIEDQEFASTNMFSGNPKTARAAPSKGIIVYSKDTKIDGLYGSSLSEFVRFKSTASGFEIKRAFMDKGDYDTPHSNGIIVENGAYGGHIVLNKAHITGVTNGLPVVQNDEATTSIKINGIETYEFKEAQISAGELPLIRSKRLTIKERAREDEIPLNIDSLARIKTPDNYDNFEIILKADAGLTLTLVDGAGVSNTARPFDLGGANLTLANNEIAILRYMKVLDAYALIGKYGS